jgi:hypothetical protein
MKIKSLICSVPFFFLVIILNGQISLKEISWNGDKKEISLDSVLKIPPSEFFSNIIKNLGELSQIETWYHGRYIKIYLLYNNEIKGQWIRGNMSNTISFSKISDNMMNYIIPYLNINNDTIYLLSIGIEMYMRNREEKINYFIYYVEEKELFGRKEYNVITIQDYPKE